LEKGNVEQKAHGDGVGREQRPRETCHPFGVA